MSIEQFIVKNAYEHGFMKLLGESLCYDRLWLDGWKYDINNINYAIISDINTGKTGPRVPTLYHLCLFNNETKQSEEDIIDNFLVGKSLPLELSVAELAKVYNAYIAVQSL